MGEEPKIAALDVTELERWLDDPELSAAEVLVDLPWLNTEAEARQFLAEIREALDDVKHGRVVPHEQIVRDAAERRRRYRASAAE